MTTTIAVQLFLLLVDHQMRLNIRNIIHEKFFSLLSNLLTNLGIYRDFICFSLAVKTAVFISIFYKLYRARAIVCASTETEKATMVMIITYFSCFSQQFYCFSSDRNYCSRKRIKYMRIALINLSREKLIRVLSLNHQERVSKYKHDR